MRAWATAAVVLAVLVGVNASASRGDDTGGGGKTRSGAETDGSPDSAADASSGDADAPLAGIEWQVIEVVEPSRSWRPTAEVDAVLRFDGDGHLSAHVCNHYSGAVHIDGDVMHVGEMGRTMMGCLNTTGDVEEVFSAVMRDEVRWRIVDGELRLDKADGYGLRFQIRDSIYPTRDLHPLLRGKREGGGDYQYGWQDGGDRIGLVWEWRDGPGKSWSSAGMNREPDWPVTQPDLLVGSAAKERFVFGLVPRATAQVVCLSPGDQTPARLELFTIRDAKTWYAFGGFVDRTKGAVVIARDGLGNELSRSRPLPS